MLGYVRVSDVDGRRGDRFISPDVQREAIERFVNGKRYELIDVVLELDESGGTVARPGLERVLERIEAGEADALAVAYLSRLSRRVLHGLEIVQRLNQQEGMTVLLVEQNATMALTIAHYGYIMENGRIVLDGTASTLQNNADIKEFYLGLSEVGVRKSYRDVKHYRRRKRWLS